MSDEVVLYYHKCDDCLTPFSSTERRIDFCDCNGSVTFMGVVQGDKYVKTENRPPCDGRCTHASGPMCDCQCGGVNHGTGRLVRTVVSEGKVKVVGLTEEDVERAQRYRKFRDCAEVIWGKRGRDYRVRRELDKILSMRTYDPRMVSLIDFIVKHKKIVDSSTR